LLASGWSAGHFQIELTREGRMDQMTIHAEARPGAWDGAGLIQPAQVLTERIKNTMGISARVIAEPPNTLARSTGKAQRVIDRRQQS